MSLSEADFEILIRDDSKEILGDIIWEEDKEHKESFVFKYPIYSTAAYPIYMSANFNFKRKTLSFSIIHREYNRIYGLDMGQNHRDPSTRKKVGRVHKHKWTELYKDQWAYSPPDITKPFDDVVGVWRQFCVESKTIHQSNMIGLPTGIQSNLF